MAYKNGQDAELLEGIIVEVGEETSGINFNLDTE